MKFFSTITKMYQAPMIHKINFIIEIYSKLKTQYYYKLFFQNIGHNTRIHSPLLIRYPQNISIGKNVFIREGIRIEAIVNRDRFTNIHIGDNTSIEQNCHITGGGELIIGNNIVMAYGAMITDIDHEYREIEINILKQPLIIRKTIIGDNCFIGSGAKIQAGTILGKQCIVGTNAVVRGIFPDYCVIVGAPAKIVKRYNPKTEKWEKTNAKGEFLDEV